ncbi:NAD(+) diphosphatase [Amnibacterium flavum]|uniref:NAD(+) diphosphatase n=2 Tax=Amnibacterium flavum TaxID=2173173 RepID=A0A2V1HQ93_9MICO|nr:NAD(+) diphosphatase [Amnibacterium flavum]
MIDRDYLTRARPGVLAELRADPSALTMFLARGRALLAEGGDGPRLELRPAATVAESATLIYLGRVTEGDLEGRPVLVAILDADEADAVSTDADRWGDLRAIATELEPLDSGLFTQALAIANWHSTHGFSPRTGEPTEPGLGGWVRHPSGQHDEESGTHIFPRTDPAVIVGIIDDEDRLLLGANARWGGDRYSVLAGFVEPGESFEAAVVREMYEEAGLRVANPTYLGSQPWPFPASIMIGFEARLAPDSVRVPVPDGVEIIDLRWFTREELSDGVRTIGIPPRASIARAIIERWFGAPLDAP